MSEGANSGRIKSAVIYQNETGKTLEFSDLITNFQYFENIYYPTISAEVEILDSANNLIASLPIQGCEKVEITVENNTNTEEVKYNFNVYKISSRFTKDRAQVYYLNLVSQETLINETVRIGKTLEGRSEDIVNEVLSNYLNTSKELDIDKSLYNIKFQPGKKSPFNIINGLRAKTVAESNKAKTKSNPSKTKKESDSQSESKSDTATTDTAEYKNAGGTAGYFFYETKSGYHFKSVDKLCSEDNGPVKTYTQENSAVGGVATNKILSVTYDNEIDVLSKLRNGAYSSLISFYNFSTGNYEEYTYSLAEQYDQLSHLGGQSGLQYGQKELSKYPTRVMSVILDHETWFSDTVPGSPEEQDGNETNPSPFPDHQKYYISQSITRFNSLENQKLNIAVPINTALEVGQQIEVLLPNQIATSQRTEEQYDNENSGVYLISQLNHAFSPKEAKANTHLTLIRDSYGRKQTGSKVK